MAIGEDWLRATERVDRTSDIIKMRGYVERISCQLAASSYCVEYVLVLPSCPRLAFDRQTSGPLIDSIWVFTHYSNLIYQNQIPDLLALSNSL